MKRAFAIATLLIAIPTCASLPAPRDGTFVDRVDLPPFPSAVPSTFGPIPVVLVKRMQRCGDKQEPNTVYYGCYHYGPRRYIEVEDTLSLVMKWRTLAHERVHLALALDGVTLADSDAENRVAEAVAKQDTHAMLLRWPR